MALNYSLDNQYRYRYYSGMEKIMPFVKLLASAPKFAGYFAQVISTDKTRCIYTVKVERMYKGATRFTTFEVPMEFTAQIPAVTHTKFQHDIDCAAKEDNGTGICTCGYEEDHGELGSENCQQCGYKP